MSVLTDAEMAYRNQRAAVKLVGAFALRQTYRRLHKRASPNDSIDLARLAAVKDELVIRGVEVPHVGPLQGGRS